MADQSQDLLLDAIRDHLVDVGVVRLPSTAGVDPAPMYIMPEGGANAPGDKKPPEDNPNIVASLYPSGGIAARPYEAFWRKSTVDIWLRCRKAPYAMELEAKIRAEFVQDPPRVEWEMAGVHVIASTEWRALQPVPAAPPGFAFVYSLFFEYYALT